MSPLVTKSEIATQLDDNTTSEFALIAMGLDKLVGDLDCFGGIDWVASWLAYSLLATHHRHNQSYAEASIRGKRSNRNEQAMRGWQWGKDGGLRCACRRSDAGLL